MKKILIILFIIPVLASAQDTTIATFTIKARLVQTLTTWVKSNEYDTAYFNLFNRWFVKMTVPVQPSGTQLVSVDSISVKVIADCYHRAYSYPQGALPVGADLAADVSAIRAANPYLDRLLDAIDVIYGAKIPNERISGRRVYSAKNN